MEKLWKEHTDGKIYSIQRSDVYVDLLYNGAVELNRSSGREIRLCKKREVILFFSLGLLLCWGRGLIGGGWHLLSSLSL